MTTHRIDSIEQVAMFNYGKKVFIVKGENLTTPIIEKAFSEYFELYIRIYEDGKTAEVKAWFD